MNILKATTLLSLFCAMLLCSCSLDEWNNKKYTKTTYIVDFYKMEGIDVETERVLIDSVLYSQIRIYPSRNVQSVASMYDDDLHLFYQCCDEHGDANYCNCEIPKMEMPPLFTASYLADDIKKIELVSCETWDEAHPAGASLNDLAYLVGFSIQPFIDKGYEKYDYSSHVQSVFFYSVFKDYKNQGLREWYPIDKPLSKITSEDMRCMGWGAPGTVIDTWPGKKHDLGSCLATLILPYPERIDSINVEVILTNCADEVYEVSASL